MSLMSFITPVLAILGVLISFLAEAPPADAQESERDATAHCADPTTSDPET